MVVLVSTDLTINDESNWEEMPDHLLDQGWYLSKENSVRKCAPLGYSGLDNPIESLTSDLLALQQNGVTGTVIFVMPDDELPYRSAVLKKTELGISAGAMIIPDIRELTTYCGEGLTKFDEFDAHNARHVVIHGLLDELVADWIACGQKRFPSKGTILELVRWSLRQIDEPEERRV